MIRKPLDIMNQQCEALDTEIREKIGQAHFLPFLEKVVMLGYYRHSRECLKSGNSSEFLKGLEDFPKYLETLIKEEKP